MPGLHVVALISGGKDSLFSILHCEANGHIIVALANLHPPTPDDKATGPIDDLESYMYQTVGHAVIPLYEEALGLPLYRQAITGTAVNKDKTYSPAAADETESLLALLQQVKRAHPEVNAVSTGAILSDYQRTRVESVALRLQLVPLSYLWQWPSLPPHTQESLLGDMGTVGQDARIVKVASGGLDESFLWLNVADRRTIFRLAKAAQKFGTAGDGAVLGEGGEYETLAVAGPPPLWKGRIEVASENIQSVRGDAGSASVQLRKPKFTPNGSSASSSSGVRIPDLFDSRFAEVRTKVLSGDDEHPDDSKAETFDPSTPEQSNDGVITLADISGVGDTVQEQTRAAMENIASRLNNVEHDVRDIIYSIIVLRQMSDFSAFNDIYGSYFTTPNPPARVTIACADVLPPAALLSISVTSASGHREGLHVQSRSYWAPANIGPYSQAIKLPESAVSATVQGAVFIAGQIPLIPATMELPDDISPSPSPTDNFVEQTCLSLQHLHRIGCAMRIGRWVFGIAFVTVFPSLGAERARIVKNAWRAWHVPTSANFVAPDEAEDFDVWNQAHGPGSVPWRERGHDEAETLRSSERSVPPLVVVQVDSLPRGADVEWLGFGGTHAERHVCSVPFHLLGVLRVLRHRIIHSQ